MTQVPGYNGKILRVNLSAGSILSEPLSEPFCRMYLGGAGFVTYYLLNELKKNIDPLGPDNKLIFACGPLTGILLSGTGRNCVGAKSPLTNGYAKSEAGEVWGAELKHAGFDAIIIEGKAERPVYLWVHNGMAELKDARHLWGQQTRETQQAIRQELGDRNVRVAQIGPGGENQVRFACIMNGLFDAAGRGGLGAVMGSKNLKAIAVRGRQAPPVADNAPIKEIRDWLAANMGLVAEFHEYGTGAGMDFFAEQGNLPVQNFRAGLFPPVEQISARSIRDQIRTGMDACWACAVRCKKKVGFSEPYRVDDAYGGPEYETLAALGSNCGIADLKAIARGNELCGAYSLDTISAGGTIAFAMECYEKGLLTKADTGGIELKFGNHEAMLQALELIGRREGLGNLLAEGTLRMAQKIGHGSIDFAVQVKGVEAGMHEPRVKPGLGLGFMVNPHGADHCCNMHDGMFTNPKSSRIKELELFGVKGALPADEISPAKATLLKVVQQKQVLLDSLVVCLFLPYRLEQLSALVTAVTGWDTTIAELLTIGERTLTMARQFNLREGLTAADDVLPARFYQPKTDGVLADKRLDPAQFEAARHSYYEQMGWDSRTGIPLPETLARLGLP